jgi:hypothetical protein
LPPVVQRFRAVEQLAGFVRHSEGKNVSRLPLRLLGLSLLILGITIPSCQAVFPRGADEPRPFTPGFVRE